MIVSIDDVSLILRPILSLYPFLYTEKDVCSELFGFLQRRSSLSFIYLSIRALTSFLCIKLPVLFAKISDYSPYYGLINELILKEDELGNLLSVQLLYESTFLLETWFGWSFKSS